MFFEGLRILTDRLAQGLVRFAPPAPTEAVERAQATLGRPLPAALRSFLLSFDGADLFDELVVLGGVGPQAFRPLVDVHREAAGAGLLAANEVGFGEAAAGDRFALAPDGAVTRIEAGSGIRFRAGRSLESWLEALIAHEEPLYGSDGEFLPDAFDEGAEIPPAVALKQAQKALRREPASADFLRARAEAERRLGRPREAAASFAEAAGLDPENPWLPFHQATIELGLGDEAAARAAFGEALTRDPGMSQALLRALRGAEEHGEQRAAAALRSIIAATSGGVRLPLAAPAAASTATTASRTPPPARRPRPGRETPPRSPSSPRARRRS